MKTLIAATALALSVAAHEPAYAQNVDIVGLSLSRDPIVLMDSTGTIAARLLNETIMLITLSNGIVAPAMVRPIYDADAHTMSGLATWQAGGTVLFTSADCTTGAHVYSLPHAGMRATTQVQTSAGTMLYVAVIGTTRTVAVRSILYDTGCSPVIIQQKGLLPVLSSVNLSAAYPPPLSFQ